MTPLRPAHLLLATVLLVALWELISADADADASPRYYGYRGYGYGRRGSYGKYIKPYYAGRYARYYDRRNRPYGYRKKGYYGPERTTLYFKPGYRKVEETYTYKPNPVVAKTYLAAPATAVRHEEVIHREPAVYEKRTEYIPVPAPEPVPYIPDPPKPAYVAAPIAAAPPPPPPAPAPPPPYIEPVVEAVALPEPVPAVPAVPAVRAVPAVPAVPVTRHHISHSAHGPDHAVHHESHDAHGIDHDHHHHEHTEDHGDHRIHHQETRGRDLHGEHVHTRHEEVKESEYEVRRVIPIPHPHVKTAYNRRLKAPSYPVHPSVEYGAHVLH